MKNLGIYIIAILLSILVVGFGYNYKETTKHPYILYNVYLDNEFIGTIESRDELEDYINKQAEEIRTNVRKYVNILDSLNTFNAQKNKVSNLSSDRAIAEFLVSNSNELKLTNADIDNLNYYLNDKVYNYTAEQIDSFREYVDTNNIYLYVNNVYVPNGIKIKKVYTYSKDILTVKNIYKKIVARKSPTIPGYKFTIKALNGKGKDITVYTLDSDIFSESIESLIMVFLDADKYMAYKNNNQKTILTTGSTVENIYIEQEITYRAVNIPVEEKIYTDSTSLSAYLLYGSDFSQKNVKVKVGDSIESIAFDNEISVQEFLIFNNQYKSRDNLLVVGTNVVISKVDPKINVVVESYEVVDREKNFETIERYDSNLTQGSVIVTQKGQKGMERVTQNVKTVNGEISYVAPVDKKTIKTSVPKIISIGTKYVPNVGSTSSWGWPTKSGYTISSYFGYRVARFSGSNWHSGIDIAGTGYGSDIYAANNGVIEEMRYNSSYGNYIIINHNNGYWSLYAHMSRFARGISVGSTVKRGQTIGYVGSTGVATGPHLHFEIRTCPKYSCTTNPLRFYR